MNKNQLQKNFDNCKKTLFSLQKDLYSIVITSVFLELKLIGDHKNSINWHFIW